VIGKTVSAERLINRIDEIIELAHGGRFEDKDSAMEAVELLKWWALDECDGWGDTSP